MQLLCLRSPGPSTPITPTDSGADRQQNGQHHDGQHDTSESSTAILDIEDLDFCSAQFGCHDFFGVSRGYGFSKHRPVYGLLDPKILAIIIHQKSIIWKKNGSTSSYGLQKFRDAVAGASFNGTQ